MTDSTAPTAVIMADHLAADRLSGVRAIADFIGEDDRRTYYLLERKLIPAGKLGSQWVGSKKRLRDHYDRITSGA